MTDSASLNEQNVPTFNVLAQYIKDLSFENPNAPTSLVPNDPPPALNVNIHVTSKALNKTDHEVTLFLKVKAESNLTLLFNVELDYAGVFQLKNIAPNDVEPLSFIEGARLLFPFAREIIASLTANGGFMPVFIEPVNFAAMYQNNLVEKSNTSNSVN